MGTKYDEHVLLLRPVTPPLDRERLAAYLNSVPGAFVDPHDSTTWILPVPASKSDQLRKWRKEHPGEHSGDTRVTLLSDGRVEVIPGNTSLDIGRARNVVAHLLDTGQWELSALGKDLGRVARIDDIFGREWPDPDQTDDPTESPPLTGRLVTLSRRRDGAREHVAVHDSGAMSYERWQGDDSRKIHRRLSPELLARWDALIDGLPLTADEPGPGGTFADPVYLRVETPTDVVADVNLDAARPTPAYREILSLMGDWADALAKDPNAIPSGLTSTDGAPTEQAKENRLEDRMRRLAAVRWGSAAKWNPVARDLLYAYYHRLLPFWPPHGGKILPADTELTFAILGRLPPDERAQLEKEAQRIIAATRGGFRQGSAMASLVLLILAFAALVDRGAIRPEHDAGEPLLKLFEAGYELHPAHGNVDVIHEAGMTTVPLPARAQIDDRPK